MVQSFEICTAFAQADLVATQVQPMNAKHLLADIGTLLRKYSSQEYVLDDFLLLKFLGVNMPN